MRDEEGTNTSPFGGSLRFCSAFRTLAAFEATHTNVGKLGAIMIYKISVNLEGHPDKPLASYRGPWWAVARPWRSCPTIRATDAG
jgi:hypothetical protein